MLQVFVLAVALSHRIPHLMRAGEVPGLAMVVIRHDRIASHQAFGVMNRETGEPLTEHDLFEAASLTKPVFAYAVLELVDAGILSLDTPLHDYLPEPVTDERMKRVTARMVLSHTTGFQNEVMPGETLSVHFAPGSRFSYSGAGYLYLERVVEHLTGKTLTPLMNELVFAPLGMRDSSYVWLPDYAERKVYGHTAANVVANRRKPSDGTIATLHTTALDYARFVVAVMNGTGLEPSTWRAMFTPQSHIDESCFTCLGSQTGQLSASLSWGLGWGLERTKRGTAFFHWGDNNAEFQHFVMAYPDGEGLIVFTNSGNGLSIMPDIVQMVLGGEHPAFAWMGYGSYRSADKLLLRDILRRGAAEALQSAVANTLSERDLNRIGYNLLQRKRLQDAIAVLALNTRRFPQSFNVFDSLGEAYAAAGDRANAIANYERSLELNPNNTNAREMLQKLRAASSLVRPAGFEPAAFSSGG